MADDRVLPEGLENVPEFVGRQGASQSLLEEAEPFEVEDEGDEENSLLCSTQKLHCNARVVMTDNSAETGEQAGSGSDDELQSEFSSTRNPAPSGSRSFGRVGSAAVMFVALAVLAIGGQRLRPGQPLQASGSRSDGGQSLREVAHGLASGNTPVEAEPRRMLVEHPEFVELIVGQVHSLHSNKTKAWLRVGIASVCKGVAELLDKHLEPEPKQALYDVRLSDSQWRDLSKLLEAGRDPRVGQLGREGLEVIQRHMFENPARTDDRLQDMLQGKLAEISILRDQLLPDSMSKLVEAWVSRRFGAEHASEGEDEESRFGAANVRSTDRPGVPLWRGMLHEQVLAGLRNGSSSDSGSVVDAQAVAPSTVGPESDFRRLLDTFASELSRRLQDAPAGEIPGDAVASWFHPDLNALEFSFSIASLSMVSVFEVLFHIEYFDHNFRMPWWAWMLIIIPTEAGTVSTCFWGFSLWCEIILGFIGLHEIELVMGLMIWHR